MGGDDLNSDDEYLTAPIHGGESSSDEQEEEVIIQNEVDGTQETSSSSRRREFINEDTSSQTKKKRKRHTEMRDLGMDIRNSSIDTQARILTDFAGVKFRANQVAVSTLADSPGFMKRIQGVISKKKLKKYNQKLSPLVVIVCLSARRAVQVLKELAPFNTRAAKLFAKHITIEEQKKQMESSSFGFAVGTPHRILTLARQSGVSFEHTQFVVLDTFLNAKNYSVYTLPDTVPHTQELLKEHIQPECNRRKNIRVAFL